MRKEPTYLMAIMLALALACSAFGCGKDSKGSKDGEKTQPAAKKDLVVQYYALAG